MTRQQTTPNRAARRRSTPEQTGRRTLPARRLRLLIFAAIAAVAGIAALGLVVSRLTPPTPSDATAVQIRASMGGFDPASLVVKPGQAVRVEFSSTDTSMHSDGGGWHELAIDALGIDWKVGPESSKVFQLTAPTTPGTYTWFCGICCGGRANPSMQGKLTVTA